MKNVTITLEDEVASWAFAWAAKQNMSISEALGDLLKNKMNHEEKYRHAMQQYLSVSPSHIKATSESYPDRGFLYRDNGDD